MVISNPQSSSSSVQQVEVVGRTRSNNTVACVGAAQATGTTRVALGVGAGSDAGEPGRDEVDSETAGLELDGVDAEGAGLGLEGAGAGDAGLGLAGDELRAAASSTGWGTMSAAVTRGEAGSSRSL
jgi:hypothetical protein